MPRRSNRLRLVVLQLMLLVGCTESASSPTHGPPLAWVGFEATLPAGWRADEGDETTLPIIITPPSGEGRILMVEITEREPRPVTQDLAIEQAERGLRVAGLDSQAVSPVARGTDHYSVTAEGEKDGVHVVLVVHVFAGTVVLGMFESSAANDPHRAAAQRILESVTPRQ